MGLLDCPGCGHDAGPDAKVCPECDRPLKLIEVEPALVRSQTPEERFRMDRLVSGSMFVGGIVAAVVGLLTVDREGGTGLFPPLTFVLAFLGGGAISLLGLCGYLITRLRMWLDRG